MRTIVMAMACCLLTFAALTSQAPAEMPVPLRVHGAKLVAALVLRPLDSPKTGPKCSGEELTSMANFPSDLTILASQLSNLG